MIEELYYSKKYNLKEAIKIIFSTENPIHKGLIISKLNENMYSINNVRVTGSHGMKYKDKWIFVEDHPDSVIIK